MDENVIKCPKCGNDVESGTLVCPKYGNNIKQNHNEFVVLIAILIILILVNVFLFSLLYKVLKPERDKNIAREKEMIQQVFRQKNSNNASNDFSSYMRNMQMNIKKNWNPPKGDMSNSVTVLYKIKNDGTLLDVLVIKSSGDNATDNSAIEAVKNAAPFEKFSSFSDKEYIEVQFTFDYNVKHAE